MYIAELFPVYPIQPVTPRSSPVKFGTRKLYVDLPYPFYKFISKSWKNNGLITRKSIIEKLQQEDFISISDIIDEYKKRRLPIARINKHFLKEFCEEINVSERLIKIYVACSWIVHNQITLPFFSLLEFKIFKYFLNEFVELYKKLAELLIEKPIKIEKPNLQQEHLLDLRNNFIWKLFHQLTRNYGGEIKKEIDETIAYLIEKNKKEYLIDPSFLLSVLHMLSPSINSIRKQYTIEDIEELINKLLAFSFDIAPYEKFQNTFSVFVEELNKRIQKFHKYSLDKKQQRELIFYLLVYYLYGLKFSI